MDDATLAAIRERHRTCGSCVSCHVCKQDWPCDAVRLLAEVDRLRAREVDVHDEWAHRLVESNRLVQEHSATITRLRAMLTPERMAAALREAEETLRDWVDFGVSTLDAAEAVLGSLRRGYPVEDGEGVPSGDGGPDVGSGVRHPPPSAPTAPPSSVGRMIIVHP